MSFDVASFVEDMDRQCLCYQRMADVAREQNRLITASDMDALLGIQTRMAALLQEHEEIERRAAPARQAWAGEKSGLGAAEVQRVEAAVTRAREALSAVLKLQEEGRSLMEKQKGMTTQDLQEIQKKRKVRNAYGKGGPAESRFYDTNQ